ncbi:unnamed protein product, partial [Mesorhabditis spiculigera]
MEIDSKIKAYRFVGYAAIGFSTVAVLSICITMPMMYNYMSHMRKQVGVEMEKCRVQVKDTWTEVYHMGAEPLVMNKTRVARQASQCEGCCLPGAAGPQGTPGKPGRPGRTGSPERGICPKYCALDGGVFFEDGTRR